jgi:poly(ADP-ribose) glycohydrolase ARH3
MDKEDRFVGSLLGLALADAMGAKFEGGFFGGLIWKALGGERGGLLRWTDDTDMAVGLAQSLVECGGLDPDHLARRWAERMDWTRGYGPGARKLLKHIRSGADWRTANRSVFPGGSFGNGGGMRAAPLGLYFHGDAGELLRAAETATSITHAHPLGLEAGKLIARAVALVLEGPFDPDRFLGALHDVCTLEEYRTRIQTARSWLGTDPAYPEVRKELGVTIRAHESAVTAVHAFVKHHDDFMALVEYVIRLGGDTDTIGAMAGGIFGALRGTAALPPNELARLESREFIEDLARRLHVAYEARS